MSFKFDNVKFWENNKNRGPWTNGHRGLMDIVDRGPKTRGVTLVELIMVIIIVGILVGVSSMYVKETIDLWRFLSFRSEVVAQGRIALIRMAREIRQIEDDTSIASADTSRIQFDYVDGAATTSVVYELVGNNLMRNSDILASGIDALNFTYYDYSNAVLNLPVADTTQIHRISVEMTVRSGTQTNTLRMQVYPRNIA